MTYVRLSNGDNRCWEWHDPTGEVKFKNGEYPTFKVGGKTYKTHRLSYWFFVGPIKTASLYVCHRCDNTLCVRPDHLFLGTHEDNMRDAKNKGRLNEATQFKKGEDSADAKLTWAQVREIRKRYRDGTHNATQLGKIYGVNRSTISHIVRNKTWKEEGT